MHSPSPVQGLTCKRTPARDASSHSFDPSILYTMLSVSKIINRHVDRFESGFVVFPTHTNTLFCRGLLVSSDKVIQEPAH
jgi:hypothetical protein